MQKIKKLTAVLLSTIMILSVFAVVPFTVNAAEYKYGDFTYKIISYYDYETDTEYNTAKITRYNGEDANVKIPEKVNGYDVTDVDIYVYCDNLESISIPASVLYIGVDSFWGMGNLENLKNIYVDSNNEDYYSIDGVLFDKKYDKELILYPAGKTQTSYTVPSGTESIRDMAIQYCTSLASITFPNSVTHIGSGMFNCCPSLTNITIPDSVTYIGKSAFYNTAWYENQPDGVVYAGKIAYVYKGEMTDNTTIVLKDGTKAIGENAFSGLKNLSNITIPNSVMIIGGHAFSGCTSLTIYGYTGTAAETYAKENGFKFKALTDDIIAGDSNGDGRVSVLDATLIQKYSASIETLTGGNLTASDVNKDGIVNVMDATEIQKYLADLPSALT